MIRHSINVGVGAVLLVGLAACISDKLPGKCASPEECPVGKCENGICVSSCQPESVADHCQSVGKICGAETWVDSCGTERTESCGTCQEPEVCGAGGRTPGKCGCDLINRPAPTNWTRWPAIPVHPPKEAYSVLSDDSVLDSQTCLIWQKNVPENPAPHAGDDNKQWFTWKEARDYCKNRNNGWRLPTKVELESIIDNSIKEPAMNKEFFGQPKSGPGGWFWSVTPYADGRFVEDGSAGSAWGVDFGDGDSNWGGVLSLNFVRCVR